ncbi:MAG: TspO/MBR family protein [Chlamydiales bacterium]
MFRTKQNSRFISFLIWYLPVVCVQFFSGKITVTSIHPWYDNLCKGSWTPPNWIFGPIWTILYLMMALAISMVYRLNAKGVQYRLAYFLFFLQLFINGLWSYVFFGLHMIGWALIDLGFLILLITIMIVWFFRICRSASLLLFPYLLWVIYAFSLNLGVWWFNPTLR